MNAQLNDIRAGCWLDIYPVTGGGDTQQPPMISATPAHGAVDATGGNVSHRRYYMDTTRFPRSPLVDIAIKGETQGEHFV